MTDEIIYIAGGIIFTLINISIIFYDIRHSIIKNTSLLLLLVIGVLFYINSLYIHSGEIYTTLLSSLIFFVLSLFLHIYKIWGAGDAKYFFILSLFLVSVGNLVYFGNIACVSLFLLAWFFLKNIFLRTKGNMSLYSLVIGDIKRKKREIIQKFSDSKIHGLTYIMNIINSFLLFFILIRIFRLIFIQHQYINNKISQYFTGNEEYILVIFLICFFILFLKAISYLKSYLKMSLDLSSQEIDTIFNSVFLICVSTILLLQIQKSGGDFFSYIYQLFTLSLSLYIGIKLFIYLYKICFINMEKNIIHINELRGKDIIEKNWLKQRMGKEFEYYGGEEEIEYIKRYINTNYTQEPYVTIVQHFSFSPVIFIAFCISYIYEASPIGTILQYGVSIMGL